MMKDEKGFEKINGKEQVVNRKDVKTVYYLTILATLVRLLFIYNPSCVVYKQM